MNTLEIYDNIKHIKIINRIDADIKRILIDTRKIKNHDCYVAIKGENFDGNKLYMEALDNGANLVILDNLQINNDLIKYLEENNKSIMIVENTSKALGELAKYKRSKLTIPVVAITGSAGKTSTKDMVYSVLNEEYNAHKTIGNQNNHLGLPLSILSLEEKDEILVLEMGMNHLGEISYLTNIAKPNIAIITNVGTAHIGNLKSRENILKAKLEILEGMDKTGTLIINNDNDLLHKWYLDNLDKYNIITIGFKNKSDFLACNIEMNEDSATFTCNNILYHLPIAGEHFIYNALVAIAIGNIFNISNESVEKGLLNFKLSSNRMNIIKNNNITIIDDSYNANYDSMQYAIKYLSSLRGRRVAVLGSMMELGSFSQKLHEDIGKIIVNEGIDILITVGSDALYINESALKLGFNKENSYHYNDNASAIELINKIKQDNDIILIKASNSLNFKEIVENIK